MSYGEYEAVKAHRWSDIKHMNDGPLAYRYHMDNGSERTAAMDFGNLVHALTLEPDDLPLRYAIWDLVDGNRNTNAYKQFVKDSEARGREVVSTDDYAAARRLRDAVHAHPAAGPLVRGAEYVEQVVQWTDCETGLPCKLRLDGLNTEGRVVIQDLKTIAAINDRAIDRTIVDRLYHGQFGHYRDGCATAFGITSEREFPIVKLVFVGKKPPHEVRVKRLSNATLWTGADLAHRLLAQVAECEASGEWPCKYPDEEKYDLPGWYSDEDDDYTETP
jgi:hypothetical protein